MVHGPDAGAVIAGLLCVLLVGIPLGLAIGAVILRAACSLYNKIVGGPTADNAVPEPGFGWAILLVFVRAVIQWIVGLVIGFAIGMVAGAGGLGAQGTAILAQIISIPIGLLISAGILAGMLPTTFLRGLAVALLEIVIIILVMVVLLIVGLGIAFLISLAR